MLQAMKKSSSRKTSSTERRQIYRETFISSGFVKIYAITLLFHMGQWVQLHRNAWDDSDPQGSSPSLLQTRRRV